MVGDSLETISALLPLLKEKKYDEALDVALGMIREPRTLTAAT